MTTPVQSGRITTLDGSGSMGLGKTTSLYEQGSIPMFCIEHCQVEWVQVRAEAKQVPVNFTLVQSGGRQAGGMTQSGMITTPVHSGRITTPIHSNGITTPVQSGGWGNHPCTIMDNNPCTIKWDNLYNQVG